MLKMPHDSEHIVTIVAIDPGTESLGFSELDIDLNTMQPVRWSPQTYVGSKLLKASEWIEQLHGSRAMRLHAHSKNLTKLFDQINPYLVACEAPFINMKRPQAYGALTEIVQVIHRAVILHHPWKKMYLIEPSIVKNAVGAKGNADKEAMKKAVIQNTPLAGVCDRSVEQLDEHEIDSGAVAYAVYKNLKAVSENKLEILA